MAARLGVAPPRSLRNRVVNRALQGFVSIGAASLGSHLGAHDHTYTICARLAGVSSAQVGAKVADLAQRRDEIIATLDLLITGI
jgi:hypothetical protein